MISLTDEPEPRFQAGSRYLGSPFFGVDIEKLQPGEAAVIDASTLGYPPRSLREIPAGEYYVQAFINVYTEFRRSDGHTIWAHQGEGQHMFLSPGNLYGEVLKVRLDPSGYAIKLGVSKVIPPLEPPPDTEWDLGFGRVSAAAPVRRKHLLSPYEAAFVMVAPRREIIGKIVAQGLGWYRDQGIAVALSRERPRRFCSLG
jgi:hypothetical protein